MRTARILFLLFLCACAGVLGWRVMQGQAFVTDILMLLPPAERDAFAESAARAVTARVTRPLLIQVTGSDAAQVQAAANTLAQSLQDSGLFTQVISRVPEQALQSLPPSLQAVQHLLLSDADRTALRDADAATLADRIGSFLFFPAGSVLADDRLGFASRYLEQLPRPMSGISVRDGWMQLHDAQHPASVLLIAETAESVFDAEPLARAGELLTRMQQQATTLGVQLRWRGALVHAVHARASAEQDLSRIGTLSTVLVLGLLWLVFRRLSVLPIMLFVITASLLGGTALTLLLFPHVHVLTYVFGTTLIGIAGDYALHYLALHAASGERWQAQQAMRDLLRPLTLAMLTTLLAYLAMAFAGFVALRQIAAFCAFGLLTGYFAVLLMLPRWLQRSCTRAPRGLAVMQRWHNLSQLARRPLARLLLAGLLLTIALPGWWRLSVNDDVHLLQARDARIDSEEQSLSALLGPATASQFFLLRADDAEQLRQREEALRAAIRALPGVVTQVRDIAAWQPSHQQLENNRLLLQQALASDGALSVALRQLELPDDWRDQWLAQLATPVASNRGDDDMQALPFLAAQRLTPEQGVASIVLLDGLRDLPALSQVNIDGVQLIDRTASISALFANWRQQGTMFVLAAFALVALVLLKREGAGATLRILLPTVLACVLTLALLGWLAQPFNLFTAIALLLVLGIGVDYALFLEQGEGHEQASLLAMVMSAITAISAFGLLAFSSQPAVQGFGVSVACGVTLALLLAPLIAGDAARGARVQS